MSHNGIYRHYKGPLYEVIGTVVHSETLEELMLYRSLKGSPEYSPDTLWVRPKSMFLGDVELDGKVVRRFTKVTES